jgi:hypothetical protein
MIELGNTVTDKITGFTGVAIGKTLYLHGCARVRVQPKELKEGKVQESEIFDELQLIENDNRKNELSELLGKTVTDTVSGIKGTVVAYTSYLYSLPRVGIQPPGTGKDGQPVEWFTVDLPQIEEYVEKKATKRTGGPGDVATRPRDIR